MSAIGFGCDGQNCETILRPGACATPGIGRGFIASTWGASPSSFTVEQLQASTWAVEVYDMRWDEKHLRTPWIACGEHVGQRQLATSTVPARWSARTTATRTNGKIVIKAMAPDSNDGTVKLLSLRGGARTQISVDFAGYGGSSDIAAQLRPGTCNRLLAAQDFPFRLWGDKDSYTQGGSTTVPTEFARFRTEHFVLELGRRWFGDDAFICIPLSPVK